MTRLRAYFYLTKPGIIAGNALTTAGGYLLAARWHIAVLRLAATIVGTSLVIGSACVINNYIDRGIDTRMQRTKWRAKATDQVSTAQASVYAVVLATVGAILLVRGANWLTAAVGATGMLFYVVLYSFMKRRSVHGTLVGCVSGATPLVAGYTAVTGRLNTACVLLFLLMIFWQLAHFYSIGLYRLQEYRSAKLPIMPVVRGAATTKRLIIVNIIGFGVTASLLTAFHYTGFIFLAAIIILTAEWLRRGFTGFKVSNDVLWGRAMFLFSLIVISSLSLLLAVGSTLA